MHQILNRLMCIVAQDLGIATDSLDNSRSQELGRGLAKQNQGYLLRCHGALQLMKMTRPGVTVGLPSDPSPMFKVIEYWVRGIGVPTGIYNMGQYVQ